MTKPELSVKNTHNPPTGGDTTRSKTKIYGMTMPIFFIEMRGKSLQYIVSKANIVLFLHEREKVFHLRKKFSDKLYLSSENQICLKITKIKLSSDFLFNKE